MTTKIRNKQTGETLTGEITPSNLTTILFRIAGCVTNVILDSVEWEILPPPLPTGIGAVAAIKSGTRFIRIDTNLWVSDANKGFYSDADVTTLTPTILSPGVEL